jgi:hypothetical protein
VCSHCRVDLDVNFSSYDIQFEIVHSLVAVKRRKMVSPEPRRCLGSVVAIRFVGVASSEPLPTAPPARLPTRHPLNVTVMRRMNFSMTRPDLT